MSRLGTLCRVFAVLLVCWGDVLLVTWSGFLSGCGPQPPPLCETDSDCDDNNGCTTDTCDFASGDCTNTADCEDDHCLTVSNDAGQEVKTCVECVGADDPACDDSVDCTTDGCDAGTCTNTPDDAACDDGDACNGAETCGTDGCVDGTAPDCDDANDCTTDGCDAATGCTNVNVADGLACDDGDLCTDADACTAGACGGTAIANCCETDADCAAGDVCNVSNQCETPAPECTADTDCDDLDVCTADVCNTTLGVCEFPDNTAPCNDDDLCTTGDVCAAGTCAGTAVTCPSGQECNPANGNCGAIQCTSAADCNDGLSCTADTCNLATGACDYTNVNTACNDGQFCSGTWTCAPTNTKADANGCVKTGSPCSGNTPVCNESANQCQACATAADCNDGFSCTTDACTIATGACTHTPNPGACNDNLFCTLNDTCAPANADANATTGCVNSGSPCTCGVGGPCGADVDPTHKKPCNELTDTCDSCNSNAACTDGITCTLDACNGATGVCSYTNTSTLCPDAAFCNGDDICNPTDADADADGCVNGLEVAYPCANACNENTNTCFACTANSDCNDGITCTTDTCNGATGACAHVGNCASNGLFCDGVESCNLQSNGCVSSGNPCGGLTPTCNDATDTCGP